MSDLDGGRRRDWMHGSSKSESHRMLMLECRDRLRERTQAAGREWINSSQMFSISKMVPRKDNVIPLVMGHP